MAREPKPDFERFMTTLYCQEPDRVPLGDWHVDRLPMESFMGRKIVNLQDEIEFWYSAGFDYMTTSSGILEPVRAPEGMTVKGAAVKTEYEEVREREWALEHEGVINSWEAFEKYPWPSVDDFDLSKWDVLDKTLPAGMQAVLLLGKIYTTVWMFMGAETFFNALENDPELIAAMFEKVGKIQYETFLRVSEHSSVGAVLNPDDIAHNTGLLIHPRYLKKYLFPWYKKIGDVCRDKGIGFIFHSDGDCTESMDDLVDCGFHGFNPIQPNCMDIDAVKKKWGHKLCLIGNLNLDSTLTLGTPDDVRAEVYERIRTIGPGGGYMVASSNSITDYVPLENMKALIDATFEFGQYPIQLEEGGVKGKVWKFRAKPKQEVSQAATPLNIDDYVANLLGNKAAELIALAQKDIDAGTSATDVVSYGLIPAMTVIGEKFQGGDIYIPEMMLAARAMSAALDHFKDQLAGKEEKKLGTVIIGTVKGDLHDIGKNLVTMMLEGQGFSVVDLGVSVGAEQFVAAALENKPNIVALSALLTTTMVEMKNTISALQEAGLRDSVKIVVGGAPVTQTFADQIGADGYGYDSPGAAQICKELVAA
ncbi:MAG: cobalamin-dependent protein [Deltaproteobacteria bacterium]|jgi:uroporphyrinogen decarboxylase|nr:cobalamin-dependent protein [Deltaproteobacteria bacterium]